MGGQIISKVQCKNEKCPLRKCKIKITKKKRSRESEPTATPRAIALMGWPDLLARRRFLTGIDTDET